MSDRTRWELYQVHDRSWVDVWVSANAPLSECGDIKLPQKETNFFFLGAFASVRSACRLYERNNSTADK
jgi:hypothetical protein